MLAFCKWTSFVRLTSRTQTWSTNKTWTSQWKTPFCFRMMSRKMFTQWRGQTIRILFKCLKTKGTYTQSLKWVILVESLRSQNCQKGLICLPRLTFPRVQLLIMNALKDQLLATTEQLHSPEQLQLNNSNTRKKKRSSKRQCLRFKSFQISLGRPLTSSKSWMDFTFQGLSKNKLSQTCLRTCNLMSSCTVKMMICWCVPKIRSTKWIQKSHNSIHISL